MGLGGVSSEDSTFLSNYLASQDKKKKKVGLQVRNPVSAREKGHLAVRLMS